MLHYLISHVTGAETCSTPIIPTNQNNISRHTLRMFRDSGVQHDSGNALHVVSLAAPETIRTGMFCSICCVLTPGPGSPGAPGIHAGGAGMTPFWPKPTQVAVAKVLQDSTDPLTASQIMVATGLGSKTVQTAIFKLRKQNLVESVRLWTMNSRERTGYRWVAWL